jgi:hypothetical protein
MRRLCVFAIASALVATAVGVAMADSGPGPGNGSPPFPFAVGAGTALTGPEQFGLEHITLSAHLGPNGPSGHYSFRAETGEQFQGDVTCMAVSGNRAAAGGPLSEPVFINGILIENAGVFVEDNGEGGAVPDRAFAPVFLPRTFERLCAGTTVLASLLTFPVERGNFVVNGG